VENEDIIAEYSPGKPFTLILPEASQIGVRGLGGEGGYLLRIGIRI
jgi:hypothetical protein